MSSLLIRPDFIFSYWIFAWAIIYYIYQSYFPDEIKIAYSGFAKYGNPKVALYCAFFENLCALVYLFVKNTKWFIIAKYIFTIVILKVIPLYLLEPYKMNLPNDLYITCLLGLLYKVYLSFFGETIANVYTKINTSISLDKNQTPLEYYFFGNKERNQI